MLNPEQQVKSLLNELRYDDWQRQFEAMNTLRRLIKFDSNVLRKDKNIHLFFAEVVKLIESLRSGLSKNALITFSEASNTFKKDLDPELEPAV